MPQNRRVQLPLSLSNRGSQGANGASSIKSKLEHISYPLDSSGARRRLLAATSVSKNGKTN